MLFRSPDTLDQAAGSVFKAIGDDERNVTERSGDIKTRIEKLLLVFCSTWPAEAQGLDASLEAAPDFMAKLERLETDGLHKFVSRFKALLREQSDQNLAVLHTRLDQERRSIQERLDQVNASLRRCAFNNNTYLVINYRDMPPVQVTDFRQQLKSALSHSFKEDDDLEMEEIIVCTLDPEKVRIALLRVQPAFRKAFEQPSSAQLAQIAHC